MRHPIARAAGVVLLWWWIGTSAFSSPPATAQVADGKPTVNGPDRAKLSEGEVPLKDFLRFLHLKTGRLVGFPSDDAAFAETVMIKVLSDIEPFTFEVAEAILAMNGYRIASRELADGKHVLELSSFHSRTSTDQPRPTPIVVRAGEIAKLGPRELGTLVHTLEHAEPDAVVQTLRELLESGPKANSGLKLVALPGGNMVIAKARARVLGHLVDLLKHIDVPAKQALPRLLVYELEHAAALDMVDLLEQALTQFGGRSVGGRSVSGRSTAGRPPRSTTPPRTGGSSSGNRNTADTRIIPDPRTQKLIVQSNAPSEIALIERLITELDVKFSSARRFTRVYAVKHHRASTMAETVSAWLQGSGLDDRFRIVPHDPTNTIIIRAVDQRYGEVLNHLFRIDVPDLTPVDRAAGGGSSGRPASELTLRSVSLETASPESVAAQLVAEFSAKRPSDEKDPKADAPGSTRIPGFHAVAHPDSGTVLIRVPAAEWRRVRDRARSLDR